jgi:putative aminopeptidase FrvX
MEKLMALLALPGPSGDEGAVAEWLLAEVPRAAPDAVLMRLGDNLLVTRGEPRVAIFAHTDTTGFTLGYHDELIPIGDPAPRPGDPVRSVSPAPDGAALRGKVRPHGKSDVYRLEADGKARPGTRWVYDREPAREGDGITAPYLDNRAGVWCALRALGRSPDVAVAFTTGEEQHGHGARVCAQWLYTRFGLTQALIADITWHTQDVRCGEGAVLSLRDAYCPRQSYLDRVVSLADQSGIRCQKEIQSAGSSDGGHLLRSSAPMDWVFVGAPEHDPHTSAERLALSDLEHLTDLLAYLADRL